ncbi:phosphate acetyltransferase, partial [Salmonella enterica subsp. enterica serovar Enteritidis str. 50-5646]
MGAGLVVTVFTLLVVWAGTLTAYCAAIKIDPAKLQESSPLPVLGAVPWSFDLIATRAIDMARHL